MPPVQPVAHLCLLARYRQPDQGQLVTFTLRRLLLMGLDQGFDLGERQLETVGEAVSAFDEVGEGVCPANL